MKYDMFEPRMKIPLTTGVDIKVKEEHIKPGKIGDVMTCPLRNAIKPFLRDTCDCIVINKYVLFYDRPFDRKNMDIVLGLGRVAMVPLDEDASKYLKDFEITGKMKEFEFELRIPESVVLDKHL